MNSGLGSSVVKTLNVANGAAVTEVFNCKDGILYAFFFPADLTQSTFAIYGVEKSDGTPARITYHSHDGTAVSSGEIVGMTVDKGAWNGIAGPLADAIAPLPFLQIVLPGDETGAKEILAAFKRPG